MWINKVKIIKLLENLTSKIRPENWVELNNDSPGTYNTISQKYSLNNSKLQDSRGWYTLVPKKFFDQFNIAEKKSFQILNPGFLMKMVNLLK